MNTFSGSSTYLGNGLTRTCAPNFYGPKPGHCIAHYTDDVVSRRPLPRFHSVHNIPHHNSHRIHTASLEEAQQREKQRESERRESAEKAVRDQETAAHNRKVSEVNRLDEQGKTHPFSQQIIAQCIDIDHASDPEHAAHLWLNHATVLMHEAEHDVKHWKHQIHVNQENKHSLCLLQYIDEARITRAIDDLTNSEIIYHDRLMQRDRARFIYDAAKNKLARVRQERQDKAHEETRTALLMYQTVVAIKNVEPVLTTESLSDKFRFLSTSQWSLKAKELASAPTLSQQIATHGKWASIESGQVLAFAGGMMASIPVELYNAVDSIVKAGMDYENTIQGLKDLVNSGNVLGNIAESVKASWHDHFDAMYAAQEQGNVASYFKAGLEGVTRLVDVDSVLAGGAGALKAGSQAVKAGAGLSDKLALKFINEKPKYSTVKSEEMGMVWGGHIKYEQGKPFEDFVGPLFFPTMQQTSDTFRVFDYVDRISGASVSVKTLNTLTHSRLQNPGQIFNTTKGYIDKVISFEADYKSGFWWRAENITSRELMLGVPAQTSIVQWEQIARAILYGQEKNVKVTVIKVE